MAEKGSFASVCFSRYCGGRPRHSTSVTGQRQQPEQALVFAHFHSGAIFFYGPVSANLTLMLPQSRKDRQKSVGKLKGKILTVYV